MKLCIVNGSPGPAGLDTYLDGLTRELESRGAGVTRFDLRDLDIRYCTGCWGCWVKTPGKCVNRDDSELVCRGIMASDMVLLASPAVMGFVSPLLKTLNDKLIPLIHPYMALVHGEVHHANRYKSYPALGLILQPAGDMTEEDLEVIFRIYRRTALNFKSDLILATTTDSRATEVADEIAGHQRVA